MGSTIRIFGAFVILPNASCAPNQANSVDTSLHGSNIDMVSLGRGFEPFRTLATPSLSFDADVEIAIQYIDKFNHLASQTDPTLIINCDETPAYVKNAPTHANHFQTRAVRGNGFVHRLDSKLRCWRRVRRPV